MIKWFLLTIAAAAASLAIYLFFYLGMNKPVEITQESRPAMSLLFKDHLGAYHQIGAALQEVEAWAFKNKLDCSLTFGEFLDDPKAVDQDRLRSRAGCLLKEPLTIPIEPYTYAEHPARQYVVARFNGAPGIGPFKVYPRVLEYFEEHRLRQAAPVIEVYSINGTQVTTEFLFPVDP